jgi:hypothetical protein
MYDLNFNFSDQQSLAGGAGVDVISTNVYDAGAAKKLFGGGDNDAELALEATATGGTTPDLRCRLVGADNAALTTNPIVLAETGVVANAQLVATVPFKRRLIVNNQETAKQYYGLIWVQSGANHTATVNGQIALGKGHQTHHMP